MGSIDIETGCRSIFSEIFDMVADSKITTIREIADDLCISKGTASSIVDTLVRFGFLQYEDDNRICVSLSKYAQTIVD